MSALLIQITHVKHYTAKYKYQQNIKVISLLYSKYKFQHNLLKNKTMVKMIHYACPFIGFADE